ncbi:CUN030 similar to AcMNPV ORF142 [Culex nigripalpus nucleopolyhedrovirus]|uniref:CUN030 similar to AcMNPV ORF142 n=1 Tax=Culex nigripalpus nucleopolyhedrovirus (isolate Florida/1997) TaxID=645993 RepID=Q919N9_NPVCO|nr:CUN030 similar to AcMNPV ORF142 [Culex nigripalpus nucleopolyhedrovirus]AAK94108.1 CUN030 similar to AcMNPV ORF142 [Culex nigripalpus nucleopolyhedrovirus]
MDESSRLYTFIGMFFKCSQEVQEWLLKSLKSEAERNFAQLVWDGSTQTYFTVAKRPDMAEMMAQMEDLVRKLKINGLVGYATNRVMYNWVQTSESYLFYRNGTFGAMPISLLPNTLIYETNLFANTSEGLASVANLLADAAFSTRINTAEVSEIELAKGTLISGSRCGFAFLSPTRDINAQQMNENEDEWPKRLCLIGADFMPTMLDVLKEEELSRRPGLSILNYHRGIELHEPFKVRPDRSWTTETSSAVEFTRQYSKEFLEQEPLERSETYLYQPSYLYEFAQSNEALFELLAQLKEKDPVLCRVVQPAGMVDRSRARFLIKRITNKRYQWLRMPELERFAVKPMSRLALAPSNGLPVMGSNKSLIPGLFVSQEFGLFVTPGFTAFNDQFAVRYADVRNLTKDVMLDKEDRAVWSIDGINVVKRNMPTQDPIHVLCRVVGSRVKSHPLESLGDMTLNALARITAEERKLKSK